MFSETIDSLSAVNKSNYNIPGITISDIQFQDDKRSVKIIPANIDTTITYNIIVSNITDKFGNKSQLKASTMIKKNTLSFPIKINVGGQVFGDYMADQEWSENNGYGYQMGDVKNWSPIIQIQNTNEQEIFHSERKGLLAYKIRVPNGNYKVKMLFADKADTAKGERVFDVYCEGNLVKKNLDLIAEAGRNTAFQLIDDCSVTDEKIDIYFCDYADSAFVNAIIIEQNPTVISDGNSDENHFSFRLEQNYPNPFNPVTKIKYRVAKTKSNYESDVNLKLEVFNLLGQKVSTLVDDYKKNGEYEVTFDGSNLASGIYFYKLIAADFCETKKLMLLK